MARARELHREAMELLTKADIAKLERKTRVYKRLLRKSQELESEAAKQLEQRFDLEPTRSLLYKGAALLCLRLGEWRMAEQHVSMALAGNPPSDIAEDLRNIFEDVTFSRHLLDKKIVLGDDEVDMSINGKLVAYGVADKDEVFRRIEVLQSLFVRTAERMHNLPFRKAGAPSKDISNRVHLFVATPRAASFGMRLKLGSEQRGIPGLDETYLLIKSTLTALDAYHRESDQELTHEIPDSLYRTNFVSQARELLPDGKQVTAVHLVADSEGQRKTVSLTTGRAKRQVRVDKGNSGSQSGISFPHVVELVGDIRTMDSVDANEYIRVITDTGTTKVYVPSEQMDSLVTYYKGEARVTARREGRKYYFIDIERLG